MNEEALKQGIELIRSGDIPSGLRIMAEIVKQDPQNDMAWVWLSACYTETERKLYCLNRAVRINPRNPLALEGLSHLGEPMPVVEPLKEELRIRESRKEGPAAKEPSSEPAAPEVKEPASVLSRFENATSNPVEVEAPDWSVKGKKPRAERKPRGKTNPLMVVLLVILVIILAVLSYLFVPRIIRQIFPEASHFNENTQVFIQEVDLLMAISDGSNNLGAFKTQQGLVYKAYDKLLMEWPPQMIYQKNEIDAALKGWSAIGAISDVAKGPGDCKVEDALLDEVKTYTNSLTIDKTCEEWASAVMEIANKHFNQARPGLESFPAR